MAARARLSTFATPTSSERREKVTLRKAGPFAGACRILLKGFWLTRLGGSQGSDFTMWPNEMGDTWRPALLMGEERNTVWTQARIGRLEDRYGGANGRGVGQSRCLGVNGNGNTLK